MDAGSLNRRVEIQQQVNAQDAAGQRVTSWQQVTERWANIAGQTGMGTITSMQEGVPASVEHYSIRLHYCQAIKAGMRAVCGDMVFVIRQVRHDVAGRQYTDLVCEVGGQE